MLNYGLGKTTCGEDGGIEFDDVEEWPVVAAARHVTTRNWAQILGPQFGTTCQGPYCEDPGTLTQLLARNLGPNPGPPFRAQEMEPNW